jgi:hypothetical protein
MLGRCVGGGEEKFHSLLTSEVDGCGGKLHVPAGFPLGKKSSTHGTGGCLDPTICLDVFEKEKFFSILGFGPRILRKLQPFISCRKYTKVQYAIVMLYFTKTGS